MSWTTQSIARHLDLTYQGREFEITGCNTLEGAKEDEISFLANSKYSKLLDKTRAGAVVLAPDQSTRRDNIFVSQNPYYDFARIVQLFARPQGCWQGQSDLAFIHAQAQVSETATIYPFAFIGPDTVVGPGSTIFSGVYIGEECRIGQDCIISANCSIMAGSILGDRVVVHSGVVLGSDGFGFAQSSDQMQKVPQIGQVVIEDDVEIGANTTVDRAALGETRIGQGTKIDNQVQIGHNVRVGKGSVIVAQVGIAGSTKIGDKVILAGQVGIVGHLSIGDGCRVGAQSGINKSIPPGTDVSGSPAMEHRQYLRCAALHQKLPDIYQRMKALESEVQSLRSLLQRDRSYEDE
ncbi:MAG: UDP-3-O-(3-hydroxymyristoyl)glucosamine N-acyltransferase [Desulfovermiculus sp.]|nr:UDP-3-O-(3-hydroxymyristoyl)glucosamine N-acyltransferase [Desulfovermiculus sp.]